MSTSSTSDSASSSEGSDDAPTFYKIDVSFEFPRPPGRQDVSFCFHRDWRDPSKVGVHFRGDDIVEWARYDSSEDLDSDPDHADRYEGCLVSLPPVYIPERLPRGTPSRLTSDSRQQGSRTPMTARKAILALVIILLVITLSDNTHVSFSSTEKVIITHNRTIDVYDTLLSILETAQIVKAELDEPQIAEGKACSDVIIEPTPGDTCIWFVQGAVHDYSENVHSMYRVLTSLDERDAFGVMNICYDMYLAASDAARLIGRSTREERDIPRPEGDHYKTECFENCASFLASQFEKAMVATSHPEVLIAPPSDSPSSNMTANLAADILLTVLEGCVNNLKEWLFRSTRAQKLLAKTQRLETVFLERLLAAESDVNASHQQEPRGESEYLHHYNWEELTLHVKQLMAQSSPRLEVSLRLVRETVAHGNKILTNFSQALDDLAALKKKNFISPQRWGSSSTNWTFPSFNALREEALQSLGTLEQLQECHWLRKDEAHAFYNPRWIDDPTRQHIYRSFYWREQTIWNKLFEWSSKIWPIPQPGEIRKHTSRIWNSRVSKNGDPNGREPYDQDGYRHVHGSDECRRACDRVGSCPDWFINPVVPREATLIE